MNILCIGDIVGKPGRQAFQGLIKGLKKEFAIDFVVVNAENAAGGAGLTSKIAQELLESGGDVLTLGDHVWDQKELEEYLQETEEVIRPANFPNGAPGKGWCIRQTSSGKKVGVVNLLGRVFMRYSVECPFRALRQIVGEIKKETNVILVDFHAEATSDKQLMGRYLDGKVSAVLGTHTHVPTADEQLLPGGTAFQCDVGMTGPYESILGRRIDRVLETTVTGCPTPFDVATDDIRLAGAIVDIDEESGHATAIRRICLRLDDID